MKTLLVAVLHEIFTEEDQQWGALDNVPADQQKKQIEIFVNT